MGYNEHVRIDLHIHSVASDGTLSPDEILSLAQEQRLGAISITDHDTLEGSKAAQQIDSPSGIKLLSGVEISAAPPPFVVRASSPVMVAASPRGGKVVDRPAGIT